MKQVDTLSVPFYEFQADETLVNDVKKIVEKLDFKISEVEITPDLSNGFYYEPMINWFEECLEKIRSEYFIDTIKLEVTNCWATRTLKLKKHHPHTHQQSLAAGIFYLDDFNTGETVFYQNNPWLSYETNNIMNIANTKMKQSLNKTGMVGPIITKITPKKGKLILYPPHILHGTLSNKDNKIRYTIAFDTFFSGRIFENSKWPYFEIKSTNIRDKKNL